MNEFEKWISTYYPDVSEEEKKRLKHAWRAGVNRFSVIMENRTLPSSKGTYVFVREIEDVINTIKE